MTISLPSAATAEAADAPATDRGAWQPLLDDVKRQAEQTIEAIATILPLAATTIEPDWDRMLLVLIA